MPNYIYECLDCQAEAIKKYPNMLTAGRDGPELQLALYEDLVLFETIHSMNPTKAELKKSVICPRCNGTNCERSFHGSKVHSYILGYGYCDKVGAKRDMDLHTLKNDDPYKEHRVEGEVDDIAAKLKKGSQPKPKYFIQSSDSKNNT